MTSFIALGVAVTFGVTRLLSQTLLRGVPSSFTLELPPYRKPQFLKILTRSVFDRTLFVLGRAVCVAAPAGLVIWILANVSVGGESLLHTASEFLDPLGRIMGLDGVLLLAFILGFPANEIVLPIAIMAYTGTSTLAELVVIRRNEGRFLPPTAGRASLRCACFSSRSFTFHAPQRFSQ